MEERMNRRNRLALWTEVVALDFLTRPESVSRLETAFESLKIGEQWDFLRGYRLAVATPLHSLLKFVIQSGYLLGLEFDEELATCFEHGRHKCGIPLLAALSAPHSHLGQICCLLNDRAVALRKAEGGLAPTLAVIGECRDLVTLFSDTIENSHIVSVDSGDRLSDQEGLRTMLVAESIVDYVEYDRSAVSGAYDFIWGGEDKFVALDENTVPDAETHLGYVSSFQFPKGQPAEWDRGVLFGFDSVLRETGVTLQCHTSSTFQFSVPPGWYKELVGLVNSAHPQHEWPSRLFGFSNLSQFSPESWKVTMNQNWRVDVADVTVKDRLEALLAPDTVRLITGGDATDFLDLDIFLTGAETAYSGSRLKVLRVVHSSATDSREWVSLAIRLPRHGLFSNQSKWCLYFKLYHLGTVVDSDVALARKEVTELLNRFKDTLDIEEISGVDEGDLLVYGSLPAFQAMRDLSKKAAEVNSKLRSRYLEILGGLWLLQEGYTNVKISLKRAALGNFEYDAVGVKEGKCLALEVKAGDVRDVALGKEVAYFSTKVQNLSAKLPALAQELGYQGEISTVSGLFITMASLGDFEFEHQTVELWDYEDFESKLKETGLRSEYIKVLDKSNIIHFFSWGEFPNDEFLVGL